MEQGKLDIQVRSHGIRDDRTFLEQYIVLEEIGKRWIREHENMKKESFNPTIGVLVAKEGNYLVMKYCTNKNIYKTTYKIINEKKLLV